MSDGRLVTNWLAGSRSNIRQTGRSERIEEILLVDICKQVCVSTKPDIAPSFLARSMLMGGIRLVQGPPGASSACLCCFSAKHNIVP